jgi:hypothetical protein
MTFEVAALKIGELQTRDLRGIVFDADHVDVLVLAADGGAPFCGRVTLGRKRSGRGFHRALICPDCGAPKNILYVVDARLACALCARHRSRRQRERTLASWRRGGGEKEDLLFRLLLRPGRRTPTTLAIAQQLVDELLAGDADRLAALRRVTDAITQVDGAGVRGDTP